MDLPHDAMNDDRHQLPYHISMPAIFRMMDANANRAREALRVMEDAARFALNDSALSAKLKSLRHDLRNALDGLPPGLLASSRNVATDVGTEITTESEMHRPDLSAIAAAAGKRLTEALRVLEETGKTLNPALASSFEQLRYRAYELDAALMTRLSSGRARQWPICLILTERECLRPWRTVLKESIAGGIDCIQVREKNLTDRALSDRIKEIIDLAHPHNLPVIVNDRADLALATGADGVHVGEDDLSIADIRNIFGSQLIIGATTHTLEEAQTALAAGADYCGIGPMFPTKIKPRLKASGPEYLGAFREKYPEASHLAIGGINPHNLPQLIAAGCRGIAVCGTICHAENPRQIVEQLRTAFEKKETQPIPETQTNH